MTDTAESLEQHRFEQFLRDFVKPIAEDGELANFEETPLMIAYKAYGIDRLYARDEKVVVARVKESIDQAIAARQRGEENKPDVAAIVDVLNDFRMKISPAEAAAMLTWIDRFDGSKENRPAIEAFVGEGITASTEHSFRELIEDAKKRLTPPPAPAAPPARTELPPPAAKIIDITDRPEWKIIGDRIREIRAGVTATDDTTEHAVKSMETALTAGGPCLTFEENRKRKPVFIVDEDDIPKDADLWFIGDVHGDALALWSILGYIDDVSSKSNKDPHIVFLGDLFDDGEFGHLVLVTVFNLMIDRPWHITLIAGNHDEALVYRNDANVFTSLVSPSEFAEWLNSRKQDAIWQRLGKAAIKLFERCPRAFILPDGLLVAHGGIPLVDLQPGIKNIDSLCEKPCLQDFVWTRAHETAKKRLPNRATKGCSFGIQDFESFCDTASAALNHPINRMIRGHDHVEDRYLVYAKYARKQLLTINAMSTRQREMFGPYVRVPCCARWVRGELPEVHRMHLPEQLVREVYPELTESQ